MTNLDSILKSRDITLPTKVHIVKSEKWKSLSRVRLFPTPWTIESMEWILQVRLLEWVAYLFCSGFSRPRNWICVSCISGRFFTNWAIREAPYSQSYGFPSHHVWMWELGYEKSWAPKDWYFELWCWRRLLRVPWTARRSKQSILKEISSEYSSEVLMLKWNSNTLATWCEELTHW